MGDRYDGHVWEQPETVWDDLRVPLTSVKLGGSKDPDFAKVLDDGDSSQGVFAYLFSATTEEEVYFAVQIPHSWKHGTQLHPHVHFMPTADGSAGQKVSWGLEYSFCKTGSVFPDTTILYNDTTYYDSDLVEKTHYLTELGEISTEGIDSVSSMLLCRVFRDATGAGGTDDYASDVALLEFDFHFQMDANGSFKEYVK